MDSSFYLTFLYLIPNTRTCKIVRQFYVWQNSFKNFRVSYLAPFSSNCRIGLHKRTLMNSSKTRRQRILDDSNISNQKAYYMNLLQGWRRWYFLYVVRIKFLSQGWKENLLTFWLTYDFQINTTFYLSRKINFFWTK